MSFKAGDWIKHPAFGAGQITTCDSPYYVIRFVTVGEKRVKSDFVMEAGSPPSPAFRFPEISRVSQRGVGSRPSSKKPAHSFEHFVERFLALYPNGFEDPGFHRDERKYKLAAIKRLKENLSVDALDNLLLSEDFAEVCKRAKQIASALNIIFPQEMMALNDALKISENQRDFAVALRDVLYGTGPKQERFEGYVAILARLGCAKWTVATYFQFLETQGEDMFMKPLVSQTMANAIGLSLLYKPEPNWDTYFRLRDVATGVEARLVSINLIPRDRVDVQSFMYVAWQDSK